MQLTLPYVFANGTGAANIIDATKVNANFDAIADILNGGLEKDNVDPASEIAIKDGAQAITGAWTFSENPIFNAGGIADAALTSNIPKKDAANSFSAKQTFAAGLDLNKQQAEQIVIHKLAAAPGTPTAGQIYYNTVDNKYYGWNGTQWNQLDYVGGYTGGSIRSYSGNGIVDDGNSFKLWFKTEGVSPTVKIALKGEAFPARFYTELGYHTHSFTGVAHAHAITDPTHRHSVSIGSHGHGSTQYGLSTHNHSIGLTSGGRSVEHAHSYETGGAGGPGSTGPDIPTHTHAVSGSTGTPSASQAIEATDIGSKNSAYVATGITVSNQTAAGSNGYAGVNGGAISSVQKLYAKGLTVQIDGTNVTGDILTATGWAAIGDGLGTHAFHTAGTGELDASAFQAYAAGFHLLEIIEGESGFGSSLLAHIESY